jgi:hypothetical protein
VLVDQFGHVKHGHLLFATEDRAEVFIRVDHAALFSILQVVLLDVCPQLLGDLSPWCRLVADHSRELSAWLHGLHERRVGLTSSSLLRGWRLLGGGFLLYGGGLFRGRFFRRLLLCGHVDLL